MADPLINPPSIVPWEPVGQSDAAALPDVAPASHPAPWRIASRGNGHEDVIASNGALVAAVYCWDEAEWQQLRAQVAKVNRAGASPASQ